VSKKPSPRRPSRRSRSSVASVGAIAETVETSSVSVADPHPRAVVTFLADWQEHRDADPTAGGQLVVAYDPARLTAHDDTPAEVVGHARFLPGGQVRSATLRGPAPLAITASDAAAHLAAADIEVPEDAQAVELWFEGTGGDETRWDSRFGQNYRFAVAPAAETAPATADTSGQTPATEAASQPATAEATVALRRGARRAPAAIRVLTDGAVKHNAFPSRPGYPSSASNLQTQLRVTARVRDAGRATRVSVDVHVLDAEGRLLHTETLPLRYDGAADDGAAQFVLDSPLYQGTVATPGSVSPRPDARAVEYRLYAEVAAGLRTDGLVHRCELKSDATSGYETL
jgi:hypothetical protein